MTMDQQPALKRRRIQMDVNDCFMLSQSSEGAAPLTNPKSIKTSSKEPNRGLYPRERFKKHPSQRSNFKQFTNLESINQVNQIFSKEVADDYSFHNEVDSSSLLSNPSSSYQSTVVNKNQVEFPSSSTLPLNVNHEISSTNDWMSKQNFHSFPETNVKAKSGKSPVNSDSDSTLDDILENPSTLVSPSQKPTVIFSSNKLLNDSTISTLPQKPEHNQGSCNKSNISESALESTKSVIKNETSDTMKTDMSCIDSLLFSSSTSGFQRGSDLLTSNKRFHVSPKKNNKSAPSTATNSLASSHNSSRILRNEDIVDSTILTLQQKPENNKASCNKSNASESAIQSPKSIIKNETSDTTKTVMSHIDSLLISSSISGFQRASDLLMSNKRFHVSPKKNNKSAPSTATNSLAQHNTPRRLKNEEVVSQFGASSYEVPGLYNQFKNAPRINARNYKDPHSSNVFLPDNVYVDSYQPTSSISPEKQTFNFQKRKKKAQKPQKNTLKNYFQVTQSPSKHSTNSSKYNIEHHLPAKQVQQKEQKTYGKNVTCTESQINFLIDGLLESDQDFATKCPDKTEDSDIQRKKSCDPYGLLGTEDFDFDTEEAYGISRFASLPAEILENIFYTLPLQDLTLSLSLVCKQWYEVIANKQFMPWKKKYFQLKSGKCQAVLEEIQNICNSHKMNSVDSCLHSFIKFMKNFKSSCPTCIIKNLKSHPYYGTTRDVMQERFPECFSKKNQNPWCFIALLCIISQSVRDNYGIIKCLLYSGSPCLISDILECLYCVATFFFHFKMEYELNSGFHYRLYYALYWYENRSVVTAGNLNALKQNSKGQQSIARYSPLDRSVKLTHEQMRIINHELLPNQMIKIVAFAGTGKTTTLVQITKLWPGKKFLNIVYNKSVSQNAVKLFPNNVTCKTIHSLAYSAVGQQFRGKLKGKLVPFDIMDVLNGGNKMIRAGQIIKTINSFVTTSDRSITSAHAPLFKTTGDEFGNKKQYTIEERINIAKEAEKVWFQMIDKRLYKLKITHDIYLKLYQLSNPVITGFDCLLIDEAQDFNAAMLDILLRQQCPKIIVGDPHQQIYSFRGASNILNEIAATHTYYLTQSFRFGPEIAFVASCALEVFKNEHRKTIVGGVHQGDITGTEEGQVAVIARTNFTLFAEAVRILCLERRNIRAAFTGGLKSYNFDQVLDIYKLMMNTSLGETKESLMIKDKFISRFSSLDKLQDYANKMDDAELMGKIKIVLTYNHRLSRYIEIIKEKCSYPLDFANVVFSTAHKAKGLEFDTVRICEDFVHRKFRFDRISKKLVYSSSIDDQDEANILYVAITRAKKNLIMSTAVLLMMLIANEKFETLTSLKYPSEYVELDDEMTICAICKESQQPKERRSVFLKQQKLVLGNNHSIEGGLICYICAGNPRYRLAHYLSNSVHGLYLDDINHRSLNFLVGPYGKEIEECQKRYANQEEYFTVPPLLDYIM